MKAINFMSSKNNDEERVLHSKSDDIEIMPNDKEDEVIEELFQSLLSRYQTGLETSVKSSDFKTEKPINKRDNKCLQCTATVASDNEEIKNIHKQHQKIKP